MTLKRRRGRTPRSESTSLGGTLDAVAREVLIATRNAMHVTQKELAKRLERPASYVSDLERGTHRMHRADFISYARALGANPHVLFARVFAGVRDFTPRSRAARTRLKTVQRLTRSHD